MLTFPPVEHYPRENLHELSSIFCKIFDPDMSPLAFELDEMYRFVTERMQCGEPGGQQTVLGWLQTLCHLGVIIPLNILFHIFSLAIACLSPSSIDNEKGMEVTLAEEQDTMKSVQIFSCMVDVLIVQLKIQDVEPHVGMNGPFTLQTLSFTLDIFSSNWLQTVFHTKLSKCQNQTEIQENIFILCQLLRNLVRLMLNQVNSDILNINLISNSLLSQDQADETDEENQNTLSTANTLINDDKKDHIKKQPGLGGFMAVLSNTFKTTVEKVPEDNSDSDSSLTVGPAELELIKEKSLDISDHPKHIQLMTKLFILISKLDDPEITFYVLDLLKSLALSEDCLYETSRKYKKLFTWLQHNHIIHNMWRILDSSHSQVALIAVPLLLSSLTLPHGSDILWKIIDEEFKQPRVAGEVRSCGEDNSDIPLPDGLPSEEEPGAEEHSLPRLLSPHLLHGRQDAAGVPESHHLPGNHTRQSHPEPALVSGVSIRPGSLRQATNSEESLSTVQQSLG